MARKTIVAMVCLGTVALVATASLLSACTGPAAPGDTAGTPDLSESAKPSLIPPTPAIAVVEPRQGDDAMDSGRIAESAQAQAGGGAAISGQLGAELTSPFTPKTATAGANVTFTGKAKPNTVMSAYFHCDADCGEYHVGVAKVGGNGSYSLTFQVPLGAKQGGRTW